MPHWSAKVNGWVNSSTDTSASIAVQVIWKDEGWNHDCRGITWDCWCDGQSQSGTSNSPYFSNPASYGEGVIATCYFDVTKGTSARNISISCTIYNYTGFDNGTMSASGSVYLSAGVYEYAPNAPSNVNIEVDGTDITISWTNNPATNKPIIGTYIDEQIEDGSWSGNINPGYTSGTQTSFTGANKSLNSKYYYRLAAYNGSGLSSYVYAGPVYTDPEAPQTAYGAQLGATVSLNADVSNIKYPDTFEWQRSEDELFTNPVDLEIADSSGVDTTSIKNPWYRVRCKGLSGTYSDWTVIQAQTIPLCYVRMPDNYDLTSNTPEIYIKVEDGTVVHMNRTLYDNRMSVTGKTLNVPAGNVSDDILTLKKDEV